MLFLGEERLFANLLGVGSSSSDCIGLFRFVLGIVPDCCKVHCVFMSVRGCSKLSLKILEKVFVLYVVCDSLKFFCVILGSFKLLCLALGSSCCLIVSSRAVSSFCLSSCFSFVVGGLTCL